MEPGGVGRKIKDYRLERGLTQMELADRVGVTYQQIQKYEKEKSRLSLQRLMRIAEVLGVSPQLLLPDSRSAVLGDPGKPSPSLTKDERALLRLFAKIRSPRLKRTIMRLVQSLVDQQKET